MLLAGKFPAGAYGDREEGGEGVNRVASIVNGHGCTGEFSNLLRFCSSVR